MNRGDPEFDRAFRLPPNAPIIGQPEAPVVMTINVLLTPKLRDRFVKWQEKIGLHINEIGATIARLGIIELSKRIDDPKDQINHPEKFFGEPQQPAE